MRASNNQSQSSLLLLPGIVDRPQLTLSIVVAYPRWRWVLPALLCTAALAVFIVTAAPYLAEQALQQRAAVMDSLAGQLGNLPEAEQAQMDEQIARFTSPGFVAGAAFVGGLLALILSWLSGSLILFFGLLLSRGQAQFAAVFAGIAWTWLPLALRDLVAAAWTAFTQQPVVNPGLSYFFSSGDPIADAGNVLWRLTSLIDVFSVWHVVLVYFLIRVLSPRGSALSLLLIYIVLSIALRMTTVLFSVIGAGL
jgi:hypothetical protein